MISNDATEEIAVQQLIGQGQQTENTRMKFRWTKEKQIETEF